MVKAGRASRFRRWLARTLWLLALLLVVIGLIRCMGTAPSDPAPPSEPVATPATLPTPPVLSPPPAAAVTADCDAPTFAEAARANAASLATMPLDAFGRPEVGWEIYAPLVAREIGSACGPGTPGFAQAFSTWQQRTGKPADGVVTAPGLQEMKAAWQAQRPVTAVRARGVCPEPPAEAELETGQPGEGYGGKVVQLRPGAFAAYRAMAAAARRENPEIAADPRNLTIFSAFRSPAYDAARCASDQNCNGVTRATCSPHRTGLALDLYVGQAPGFGPDSSADPNRLAQSRSASYRWLVANARRFGFVNYPFEPWHWEWIGEAP